MFNQLIRPRLRVLIPDIYKNITYNLDEDSYSLAEQQDFVRKRFVKSWDELFEGFKVSDIFTIYAFNVDDVFEDTLTTQNYRSLLTQAVDVVIRPWEKYILTLKYSEVSLFY